MADSSPLNKQEQADLVAYLDGELKGEAAQRVETRIALDPSVRAEAEALRRTWDLLDFLPRPELSSDFTQRTVSQAVPVRAGAKSAAAAPYRLPWLLGAGWAAAVLVAAAAGYTGSQLLVPKQPGEPELVRDLRIIENKRLYELVGDMDFLR